MSDPARSDAPFDLTTERLEAFSDAVIAVIITILALGLEIPTRHLVGRRSASHVGPFLIYVLAFVNLAIWWNNHHHLLRATTRINGAVMWANMALLFFLSLIPVATEWLRARLRGEAGRVLRDRVVVCGGRVLGARANDHPSQRARLRRGAVVARRYQGPGVDRAVRRRRRDRDAQRVDPDGEAATAALSVAFYVAVAIIWLIPDRRFLHDHAADGSDSPPGHPQ